VVRLEFDSLHYGNYESCFVNINKALLALKTNYQTRLGYIFNTGDVITVDLRPLIMVLWSEYDSKHETGIPWSCTSGNTDDA